MPIIAVEIMRTIDERESAIDTRCVVMRWSNGEV